MINVTTANFEAEVIEASMDTPVLVDFWAPWCGPCKVIGPLLEKLETDYDGRFKLVKIDSDQEQELSQAFGIRSIPTCVLMMGGKPVDGFMGAVPEGQLKAFLEKNLPPADILEAEVTGESVADAPDANDPQAQHEALQQAVLQKPEDDDARFAYVKFLLQHDKLGEAKAALAPALPRIALVRRIESLQHWVSAVDFTAEQGDAAAALAGFESRIAAGKRDFDARFGKARLHMAAQAWTEAMDELLEILMRDKSWNEELARKTFVAILDIIEPPPVKVADGQIPPVDPVLASYRRRLSSVVLS
jgi:putative thioredoxin